MASNQNLVARIIINAQDNASSAFRTIQDNAGRLASALVAYFAVDFFKGAVDSAADFELALDKVAAKGGYTATEMDKMRVSAQDIGATFGVSGTKAAEGLEVLAAAGLKSSEAISALPNVMKLAKAENMSMEESATIVSNTVSTMGLSFDDTARIAGTFVKAANLSTVSAKDLGEAFKYSASIASGSKLSLEELAGVMDALASKGVKGGEAGTALRSILLQLDDPASKASKELDKLGISSRDLATVMTELKSRGDNSKEAMRAFGTEAATAIKGLVDIGGTAIGGFADKIRGAGDAAGDTATTMAENFKGAQGKLSATFDNLKEAIGAPILKPLIESFDKLSEKFNLFKNSGVAKAIGDSLARSFESGTKAVEEFLSKINFTKAGQETKLFADRVSQTFELIGSNAKDMGNVFSLVFGDLKTGFNTIQSVAAILESGFVGSFGAIRKAIGETSVGISEFLEKIPGLSKVGDGFKTLGEKLKTSGDLLLGFADDLKKEAGVQLDEATKSAEKTSKAFVDLAERTGKTTKSFDDIWKVSDTVTTAFNGSENASNKTAGSMLSLAEAQKMARDAAESLIGKTGQATSAQDSLNKATTESEKTWKRYIDQSDHVNYTTGEVAKGMEYTSLKTNDVKNNIDNSLYTWRRYTDALGNASYVQTNQSKGNDKTYQWFKDMPKEVNATTKSIDSNSTATATQTDRIYKSIDALGRVTYSHQKLAENTEIAVTKTGELSKSVDAIPDKESKITANTTTANTDVENVKAKIAEIPAETKTTAKVNEEGTQDVLNALGQIPRDVYTTVHVRSVQENSAGGQIQYFSKGGSPDINYNFQRREGGLGGYGGGDTIPAMLEPGEWIIKKESVAKYGDGFMAKLNAGQIDNVPKFATGGNVITGDARYISQSRVSNADDGYQIQSAKSDNLNAIFMRELRDDTSRLNQDATAATDNLNKFLTTYQKNSIDLKKEINSSRGGRTSRNESDFIREIWDFTDRVVKGRSNPVDITESTKNITLAWDAVEYENGKISIEEFNRDKLKAATINVPMSLQNYNDNMAKIAELNEAISSGNVHKRKSRQVGSTKQTQPFFKANGGYIEGEGTGTSDEIPAMLSNGEYVIKADAVDKIGVNTLDKINNGEKPQGFSTGGGVGDTPTQPSKPTITEEIIIRFIAANGTQATAQSSKNDAKSIVEMIKQASLSS